MIRGNRAKSLVQRLIPFWFDGTAHMLISLRDYSGLGLPYVTPHLLPLVLPVVGYVRGVAVPKVCTQRWFQPPPETDSYIVYVLFIFVNPPILIQWHAFLISLRYSLCVYLP
jgi:hypothetical protein